MPIRSARRRVGRAALVLLMTCAPLGGLTQAVASAGAAVAGRGVIGDGFDAAVGQLESAANGINALPGPDQGDATAVVDESAGRLQVLVGEDGRQSELTLAWPLRVGTWKLVASSSGEPEQHVIFRRIDEFNGCQVNNGTLVVHAVEADADGHVPILVADIRGGQCGTGRPAAQIRIGTSSPTSAVSMATPRAFETQAEQGSVVTQQVTITNTGPGPWTVRESAVARIDAHASSRARSLAIRSETDTCTGRTLPAGGRCELTVAGTATDRITGEHLVVAGDGAADVVVPLYIEGLAHVPAPTDVAVIAGRTGAQVSWTSPYYSRSGYTRIYDVTGGGRALLLVTPRASGRQTARLPGPGPRTLALVNSGEPIVSPEVRVEVPAEPAELVAEGVSGFGPPVAFALGGSQQASHERAAAWTIRYRNGPNSVAETSGDGVSLDPTRTRWLVQSRGGGLWLCDFDGAACTAIPGTTPDVIGYVQAAVWLPDGRIAALTGMADDGVLWTVALDGTTRRVANLPLMSYGANLAALPSGSEVIAAIGGDIQRIRLSDGHLTLVPGTRSVDDFTVTTVGTLVLQERIDLSQVGGPTRTRVIGLDGETVRVLPLPPGDNRRVTLDPAGERLAFVRQLSNESAEIWTANADGTGAAKVSTQVRTWGRLHWSVDDKAAPTVRLALPAASAGAVTIGVTAADADDPVGGLRRECRLDSEAWTACGGNWKLSGLRAGMHTAAARVTGASGRTVTAARSWTVDLTAPRTTTKSAPSTVAKSWRLRWSATDRGGAGIASYDVRVRQRTSKSYTKWKSPTGWLKITVTSVHPPLKAGGRYCFEVRARDSVGNKGEWSKSRCVTVRS